MLAYDLTLKRHVAVKRPRPEILERELGRKRFLREARAAAQLNHSHIITVHRAEEDEEGPYIEMEYIEGDAYTVGW